jgi:DNA polymerase I-like protein with 3'-5' exonuclease and polymerase domains
VNVAVDLATVAAGADPIAAWTRWLFEQAVEVEYIANPIRARRVIASAGAHRGPLAFDIETAASGGGAAVDPLAGAYIRLAQLFGGGRTVYVLDVVRIGGAAILAPLAGRRLVTFGATFEAKFLLAAGFSFPFLDDAQLAAGLRLDRDHFGRGDLVSVVRRVCPGLKVPLSRDKRAMQQSDFSRPALSEEQIAYAAADAVMTLALWEVCQSEISKAPKAYAAAQGALLATARMELQGLPFDRKAHRWIATHWAELKAAEDNRFEEMTGLRATQRKAFSGWLQERLKPATLKRWPRTDTGGLMLKGKRLRALGLADASPAVRQYLQAQLLETLVKTFGHPLAELVSPKTGRLHYRLRIAGARTGRYTSSSPNCQNMHGGPFRQVVAANKGRVILWADFAAVELRVAALLARERTLLKVFRHSPRLPDGSRNPTGDPHMALSVELRLDPRENAKLRLAKALNFGTIYGISAKGFAIYANLSEADAGAYLDKYWLLRSSLRAWQRKTNRQVQITRVSRTVFGRTVNCVIPEKRRHGVLVAPQRLSMTRGLNVPVQGSAAEAMLIAVAKVDTDFTAAGIDAALCVTVHDELVAEASDADADRAATIMANGMRMGFAAVFRDLPGYADAARHVVGKVERGASWGGGRFDPAKLSDDDRAMLFKGLDDDRSDDAVVDGDDDDA